MAVTEGAVCPGCVTGFIHEGTPKGTVGTIANLETYIAKPSTTKDTAIIVIIPDVFGWKFVNNQLLADEYAEKSGKTVYLPDFMFGDSPDSTFVTQIDPIDGSTPGIFQKIKGFANAAITMVPWFWSHRQAITIPIVKSFFGTLRTENPEAKIGVAGFCWGGRYAILLGEESFSEEKLVDAAFSGHPSFVSIPNDVQSLTCPQSIAVASTDTVFSPKMAAEVETLWSHDDQETEIVIYEGAKHGFCVRGNMNHEKEKEDMEKAVSQAVNWFNKHLS